MRVKMLPLLQVQRELLDEPRGFGRFQSYLKSMVAEDGELGLPLGAFNPMSKPHVAALLDKLIAMDAEAVAEEAMVVAAGRLRGVKTLERMPDYRFGLVIADDAMGGWTNRYLFEAKDRFESTYGVRKGFITALLWSSEEASLERVRLETAAAVYRTAWIWVHGLPKTLGEMMRQEGFAARFAGVDDAGVDAQVVELVKEHAESTHYPILMACLYGDAAAETLGYDVIGMLEGGALRFAGSGALLGEGDAVAALA